jgi:CheY-like chemotaxis protein
MSRRPRVLLADDYPDMLKAVRRLLEPECDIAGSVADGGVLLEEARRLVPDVIVLDLSLPTVSGLDACRELSQTHPAIKLIVFTASGDPEVEQQALDAGAAAYVSKLSSIDLMAAIKRLCTVPPPPA